MENASKALIIAGAILLSILIVSLGIMVFQNAKNTVSSSNLNKQEIEAFNSQWEGYEGTKKTASEVRSAAQAIIASNASETKSGTNRWVSFTNAAAASTTAQTTQPSVTVPSTLANSKTYTIKVGYDTNGLVVDIAWNANS